MNHTLIVEPISKRIRIKENSTVYSALLSLNYPIGALCGGKGSCGKCKILCIKHKENLSPINSVEKKLLTPLELSKGTRLACQCKVKGDVRIMLLEGLMSIGNKILVDSDLKELKGNVPESLQPNIKMLHLRVKLPNLENPMDDLSRVISEINRIFSQEEVTIDIVGNDWYRLAKILPPVLREKNGEVTVYYMKVLGYLKILDIVSGHREKLYGLAVDLGTTTVVGYLIDLQTGNIESISSMLNPQVTIGEDLVTRITYIKQNKAEMKAQDLIFNAFTQILNEVCQDVEIKSSEVREIVVVGNTGMHHMFYGLPTDQLAMTPFVPVFKSPIYISAEELGLKDLYKTRVYSPPVIAGFVGTDTVGCIVSSRIDKYDKNSLLIDIGTNGELVLGNKNGLTCGSCAAGSALEGAHIAYGMRAAEGAIENLTINPNSFETSIRTIGNTKPIGYCGSGLIDLIAEMIKCKIIKRNGNFNLKNIPETMLVKSEKSIQYVIYDSEKNGTIFNDTRRDFKITISQKDVRQFQLAKGAFLSGAYLLNRSANEFGIIEQVLLAGAFGNYIDKENARIIGLFPEINPENIYQIGNAAGLGAQICLKNLEMRQYANKVAHKVNYFEIASAKEFQKEYAFSMYFPHYNLDKFPSLEEIYHDIPLR